MMLINGPTIGPRIMTLIIRGPKSGPNRPPYNDLDYTGAQKQPKQAPRIMTLIIRGPKSGLNRPPYNDLDYMGAQKWPEQAPV